MARKRKPAFVCPVCGRRMPKEASRVSVAGRTTCGDCAYKREIRADGPQLVRHREPKKPGKDQLTIDATRAG